MASDIERRLRKLEAAPAGDGHGTGKFHLVLVRPDQSEADAVAAIVDRHPRDELCIVRFVRPGEPVPPAVH